MPPPDPKTSSRWLTALHKELLRGRQVLLHGNVADMLQVDGEYTTMREFLSRYFPAEGFQLVAHYDIVDGLQLAETARMRPLFQQLRGGGAGTVPPPPPSTPAATPPAASRRVVPPAVGPNSDPVGGDHGGLDAALLRPENALPAVRALLAQRRVPTAISLAFTDKLVGDAQHQSGDEPRLLVLLKKMIQEGALIDAGPLRNRRNALVIIAEHLSGVPAWVYQNNPLLKLIHVPRPDRDERARFYAAHVADFHGGAALGPDDRAKGEREFADLTDGLTAHDLHAMRRTSVLEERTVARPRELVTFYKFGDEKDPWALLNADKVRGAGPFLADRVIGQETAVRAVVDMLVTARVGLSLGDGGRGSRPKGVFFFVGPTGVGKTELAKALSELLFGDATAFARFDMSEYTAEHAADKLTGSPPGYVGYDEGGQLTRRVLEKPFSLLLFDEIEKAHGRIMDKFLQVLEDGRLTDSKGQTADFSQSVVVFTSNIGADTFQYAGSGPDSLPVYDTEVKKHFLEMVKVHFTQGLGRPELLNRLGNNILVFDMLRPQYVRKIARKFLNDLTRVAWERLQLTLRFDDGVTTMIEEQMRADPAKFQMGGRQIRTLVETMVLQEITGHVSERFNLVVPPGTTLDIAPAQDRRHVIIR